ncbi:hypothetical protein [Cohnella endophytica]|uniref:hypothetical protein n=1 Tax=Cohnella endophytica TaxID=2419778 RepID=UPI0011C46A91|nr:hypothetical protein [Cohnella endophytica]
MPIGRSRPFYCETSESGNFNGILKVLDTSMNRVANGKSKWFFGTIYTNLEHGAKIHYIVNGEFYNNGTITVTGTGTGTGTGGITVGGFFTMTFSVSSSSNFNATLYIADDFYWN